MKARGIIARLDYAVLAPQATVNDLESACEETRKWRFNALTVSPWMVQAAIDGLQGSRLLVGTVAGFPSGTATTEAKCYEAAEAVGAGVAMVDMVLALGRLKSGDDRGVFRELEAVRTAVDDAAGSRRVELRGILETGLLTDEEVARAAQAVVDAGWDMVKTSTGFGPRGAEAGEVRRLAELVRGRAGVKASGGIRSASDVLAMLAAGADVVGTGSAPAIAAELERIEADGEL